ncbi:MAG TPA: Gfo/Idh/MocA family oxidoreductase, partial [Bryobacteraceae bacterium]|nr:Gfo/Idh/MocA family oxidoreductase [Bryobacteraceae bacterium]
MYAQASPTQGALPRDIKRAAPQSDRKIRIGVVGGGFGATFHWHEHPNCVVTAATDLHAARRDRLRQVYKCDNVYPSLDAMLAARKDLDAVAVFSGALDHVKHAVQCMRQGLHVVSACPACTTVEEAAELKQVKESTGRKYMMAESSFYRSGCIYARGLFENDGFGKVIYQEVEYYHDFPPDKLLADPKSLYFNPDGSKSWRRAYPPLLYPTHSLGYVTGVTQERITSVSALGWGANYAIYRNRENAYKNPISNGTALMQTNEGNTVRCNVFWSVVGEGEQARWYGDKGAFLMALPGVHADSWQPRGAKAQPVTLPPYWDSAVLPK